MQDLDLTAQQNPAYDGMYTNIVIFDRIMYLPVYPQTLMVRRTLNS